MNRITKVSRLTQERLKEVLVYDKYSGLFTSIADRGRVKKGSVLGSLHKYGYLTIGIDNALHRSHRLAFLYVCGKFPDNVDHIDHDRSNNKWSNIRDVSYRQNSQNMSISKRNTSGYTGVFRQKGCEKWRVLINIEGKNTHIGMFHCVHEAGAAAKSARSAAGYHENHGI